MKKKFALLLLSLLCLCACALGLTACNSATGTYYRVNSKGEVEMNAFIKLDGNKWENYEGFSGTYEIKDETITFYMEMFGEKSEFLTGSYQDGIIKINSFSGKETYVSENHKHTYGAWEKESEATCTADGVEIRVCACGIKESRSWQPAKGHTPILKMDETSHYQECTVCNQIVPDTFEQHKNSNSATCDICGYPMYDSVDLSFKQYDNFYAVSGLGRVTETAIKIPSAINGLPVTRIDDEAFRSSNITLVIIPDSITSIGNRAFYNCSSLTNILIPDSVTSIGSDAFRECTSLKSITIPNSVTSLSSTFYGCSSLTSITLPNSVTSLSGTFYGCSSLTSITLPNSVTSIGERTLYDCSSLTSITIPNSVTSIGEYAFYGCSSLTSITIPDSVTSIGSYAFRGCSSLESVHINDLTSWCSIKFNNSYSNPLYYAHNLYLNNELITNLTIPESVTAIGDYAFTGCTSLTSISIPGSVTSIGKFAFSSCTSIQTINLNEGIKYIKSQAFSFTSITTLIIPSSVINIEMGSFGGCLSLTNIVVEENNPNYKSLNNCILSKDGLTLVIGNLQGTIPESVTSIFDGAFAGNTLITGITIPNSITYMGEYLFSKCTSLTSITFDGTVAQWNAIIKGDNWDLNTGNYTIYCTDGEIAKDGTVTMY